MRITFSRNVFCGATRPRLDGIADVSTTSSASSHLTDVINVVTNDAALRTNTPNNLAMLHMSLRYSGGAGNDGCDCVPPTRGFWGPSPLNPVNLTFLIYARSILFPPYLVGPSTPLIDQRSGESRKLPSGRRRFLSIPDTNLVIGALPAAGGSAPMSSDTRQHAV